MFAPSGVISESCSYTRWRLGLFIFPSELQKKEVWQLKKHKFIFYLTLFIGVEAVLFLLGLFLAGGVKNGFIVSFQLIPTAFPLCGMIFLVLYFFAWVHYRLLVVFLGREAKERQLDAVRFGTLGLTGFFEVFALATLPHANSTYSLIVFYIPPLALVTFRS